MMDRQMWIRNIVNFQAWCRGYLIRKDLKSVQTEFKDIVKELEGHLDHLNWRGSIIPVPHFTDDESRLFPFKYCSPKVQNQRRSGSPEKKKDETEVSEKPLSCTEILVPERDEEPSQSPKRDVGLSSTPPGDEGERKDEREDGKKENLNSLEMNYSSFMQKGHQQRSLVKDMAREPEALRHHRNTLTMELLWIQQAIASRKKYLTMKQRMEMT